MSTHTYSLEDDIHAGMRAVEPVSVLSDMALAGHTLTLCLIALTGMSAARGLERRIRRVVNNPAAASHVLDAECGFQDSLRKAQGRAKKVLSGLDDIMREDGIGFATRVSISLAVWATRRMHAAFGTAAMLIAEHDADASPRSGKTFQSASDLLANLSNH